MSLQITEKSSKGLSKVYGVLVPAKDLTDKLEAKIAEVTPQMRLKGFRPGKVPQAHVKRMYGKSLMGEVVQDVIEQSSQKAIEDAKLRPAMQPDLTLQSDMDKVLDGKADLAYDLAVEVIPEFKPADISKLKLKRPVHEPTDAEVAEEIKALAAQNRTYEPRKGKSLKAKDGDLLVIDFIGRIDGEAFEGGSATDAEVVIGAGRFIPGFEEQLKGAAPDSDVTIKVSFPDDYPAETLKGKAAEFEVKVKEVKAPIDAPADDEFAKGLGLESLDALKDIIKSQLKGRYDSMSRFKLKRSLLDELDKGHDFDLPKGMVDAEFDGIWRQVEHEKSHGNLDDEDSKKPEKDLRADYRKIAERRVRLGLVLAEIGKDMDIKISEQEVMEAARAEAMRYRGQEQQVFDMIRQNPDAMASLRAPIYEDKVVDAIFEKAKVTDEKVSKDKLAEDDEMPDGY